MRTPLLVICLSLSGLIPNTIGVSLPGYDGSIGIPSRTVDQRLEVEQVWSDGGERGLAQGEKGWLSRWLSMGGEGSVTISYSGTNFTLPHRPAAFPTHLSSTNNLPLSGFIKPFLSLPPPHPTSSSQFLTTDVDGTKLDPSLACLPPAFPPIRFSTPPKPYTFALIERGGCDFATKVRSAQERGARGVICGDGVLRDGETDIEGRTREALITMFSPEDTESIFIPSVFVSRASFLVLRDLLANNTDSGRPEGEGLWIEIGEGIDEGGALSSLVSFALLMPSLFLLATIAIHRIRVSRQREADRAPPLLVLSLPERIWTPDIVWEKDDSDSDSSHSPSPKSKTLDGDEGTEQPRQSTSHLSPLLSPSSPTIRGDTELSSPTHTHDEQQQQQPTSAITVAIPRTKDKSKPKKRTKSTIKRHYYSKDECAICMESFEKGDVVRILPCGHVFHKDECDEWLMKWRKLCPTCRADVTLLNTVPPSTTLTPVINPLDPAPLQTRTPTYLTRIQTAWQRVWRRQPIALDEEAGERTPLVNTSSREG